MAPPHSPPEEEVRLTVDQRHRIAAALRLLRAQRALHQRDLARRARVSLGTLQMIEKGSGRDVRRGNVEKVAHALGLTLSGLLRVPGPLPDPLLADLNREDLVIARQFHGAILDMRLAVKGLLEHPGDEAQRGVLARLVQALTTAEATVVADMVAMTCDTAGT